MLIDASKFDSVDSLHKWLSSNKSMLAAQKKSAMKFADPVNFGSMIFGAKDFKTQKVEGNVIIKAEPVSQDAKSIMVVAVINTTGYFDSHGDVHINGLWNKSIKENRQNYLVKEHNFSFDGVITDKVDVSLSMLTWKSLDYDYAGETQALIYSSEIVKAEDTTGMFDKYVQNKVPQHSVGMRYVSLDLAIDNKRYPDEQKIWNKYYNVIVNKEDVEKYGYFWAVTEAKNNEGSAVLKGSNPVTPVLSIEDTSQSQPMKITAKQEPMKITLSVKDVVSKYEPLKFIK